MSGSKVSRCDGCRSCVSLDAALPIADSRPVRDGDALARRLATVPDALAEVASAAR
jgi:hypothetical protein